VRGTASIVDGLEDLDLWSEALQLELVSMVFPFVFTWPDSSTAALVQVPRLLSKPFGLLRAILYAMFGSMCGIIASTR
jgi:hypothetical protein